VVNVTFAVDSATEQEIVLMQDAAAVVAAAAVAAAVLLLAAEETAEAQLQSEDDEADLPLGAIVTVVDPPLQLVEEQGAHHQTLVVIAEALPHKKEAPHLKGSIERGAEALKAEALLLPRGLVLILARLLRLLQPSEVILFPLFPLSIFALSFFGTNEI